MNNTVCMYVDIYTFLKKAPRIAPHVIKRSPLSLKARKHRDSLKLEHPCSNIRYCLPPQPMILAPENTQVPSQLQYSWQGSMKSTLGRYLKQIHASSIVAVHHSIRAIQIHHQRATLSIAAWTRSPSLLNYSTAMILRCQILYRICPPSFKAFSLRCVEAQSKVSNLIVTNYGTVSSHLHERVQKVREPISSPPSQIR